MPIDKSNYGGAVTDGMKNYRTGLSDATDPIIEIEIEGAEVVAEPEKKESKHDENLAKKFDAEKLKEISTTLLEKVNSDQRSRSDWERTYKDGLKLLGLKIEEVTKPWAGACNVVHPLLSEAVVKFQAETILETFPAAGPVKTKIIGKQTKEREQASDRVMEDMNWRLTEEMTEYRQEHERLLWNLPIAGSGFKKVYFDYCLGRQTSRFVPAEDFIVAYGASDLQTADRYTHRMVKSEYELETDIRGGLYVEKDLETLKAAPQESSIKTEKDKLVGSTNVDNDGYCIFEVHTFMDLEDHGYACPYVVTICESTGDVLAIYRNWDEEDDELKRRKDYFVHYPYIVGFGFYGFGLLHLIGSHASAATSITRQLVDAGTLSNLPGGFKTKGMRVKGDDTPITPGEFRDVDVPSGKIQENVMALPYKEPSAVLFQLLQNIVEEGRRFASVSDATLADANQQAPVGTTLALLERTLKVMSAVQARVHAALKQEFKLIKNCVRDNTDDDYDYDVDPDKTVKKADYDIVEIIPVSDPNAATMAQRIMQYQAVVELAKQEPQLYDKAEIHREMLHAMGVKNAAKLLPSIEEQPPRDPISENMAVLMGKPIRAFAYQDHEAHLAAHQAFMQDPKLSMVLGQNPNAQLMFNAMQSHVAEHAAYAYRKQAELLMGVTLPDPNEPMPQEVEFQLSGLMAQAAQKVLQTNQAAAAQQQAQQQQQDPVFQLEQAKVQIQADGNQVKREKIQSDERIKAQELAAEVGLNQQKAIAEQAKSTQDVQASREKHQLEMSREQMKTQLTAIQGRQKASEGQQKLQASVFANRQKLQAAEVANRQKIEFTRQANEQKLEAQKRAAAAKPKKESK